MKCIIYLFFVRDIVNRQNMNHISPFEKKINFQVEKFYVNVKQKLR